MHIRPNWGLFEGFEKISLTWPFGKSVTIVVREKSTHIGIWLFLAGLLGAMPLSAQPNMDAIVSRMDAFLAKSSQKSSFSGVVYVGKRQEVLLSKGYGWANPRRKEMNNPGKRFMIASVSKAFAAAAILQLEDRGLLKVNDPIGKYLPEYPDWAADAITIHNLLSHTSGIPDYINDFPIEFKFRQMLGWNPGKDELISIFQDRPLNFYPGERFRYSNSGYVLLAKIVEVVTGEEYDTYLWKNILQPLEMDDTGLGDFNMIGNRSVAHKGSLTRSRMIRNFNYQWIYGMGEMYATAGDLNKWLQSFSDTLILSRAAQEKMFQPVENGYAYGWHVRDQFGHTQYSHGGYLPGWNSHVFYYPEEAISIIVLSNNQDANPLDLGRNLSGILFRNEIEKLRPSPTRDLYAGRYELLNTTRKARATLPIPAEILMVNERPDLLELRTPKGQSMYFVRSEKGRWMDDGAQEIQLTFSKNENRLVLRMSKGGQQWQWQKMHGGN